MKTIYAAALAAATVFAGAAHASEATHNDTQVRSAIAQPAQAGQASGFGGLSIDRSAGVANGAYVADPARSANSGN